MEKIILCKCFFGGYDFCDACGGSGVIIIHEEDDYKHLVIGKTILPNTTTILTLVDKIKSEIAKDDNYFMFITKNFKKLFPNKKIVLKKLETRIHQWKISIIKIKVESLKMEIERYIQGMEREVQIVRNQFYSTSKPKEKHSYIPKLARQRRKGKR